MKILVVDDEKLLVKGIKFNLENDGYTVDSCYDGEAALGKLRQQGVGQNEQGCQAYQGKCRCELTPGVG